MPRVSLERQEELRSHIRELVAMNPSMTTHQIQKRLCERGFVTSAGNLLNHTYLNRLRHKVAREAMVSIDRAQIRERLALMRSRFMVSFERLSKIAFWNWDYLQDGISMPEPKDITKAIEVMMKMDIELLQTEMDAGIYERKIGTIKLDASAEDVVQERWQPVLAAMKNFGLVKKQNVDGLTTSTGGGEQSGVSKADAA